MLPFCKQIFLLPYNSLSPFLRGLCNTTNRFLTFVRTTFNAPYILFPFGTKPKSYCTFAYYSPSPQSLVHQEMVIYTLTFERNSFNEEEALFYFLEANFLLPYIRFLCSLAVFNIPRTGFRLFVRYHIQWEVGFACSLPVRDVSTARNFFDFYTYHIQWKGSFACFFGPIQKSSCTFARSPRPRDFGTPRNIFGYCTYHFQREIRLVFFSGPIQSLIKHSLTTLLHGTLVHH